MSPTHFVFNIRHQHRCNQSLHHMLMLFLHMNVKFFQFIECLQMYQLIYVSNKMIYIHDLFNNLFSYLWAWFATSLWCSCQWSFFVFHRIFSLRTFTTLNGFQNDSHSLSLNYNDLKAVIWKPTLVFSSRARVSMLNTI